jgi:hypothetical protein
MFDRPNDQSDHRRTDPAERIVHPATGCVGPKSIMDALGRSSEWVHGKLYNRKLPERERPQFRQSDVLLDNCWNVDGYTLHDAQHGDNLTATATFNCVAPGASITATTSSVNVGLSSLPYFGSNALYFNSNSGTAGISFSQTVTVPGGFSGITEWLQFVESSATRHSSGGAQNRNLPGGCLDTTYPYSTSASTRDSPAQQLNSPYDSYTRADTFTMFLMFQPTGGIFVPIRLVNWSWSGAASLSGGTWVGANRSWTSNPGDAAPSWNPTWTCNAANYLNSWQ